MRPTRRRSRRLRRGVLHEFRTSGDLMAHLDATEIERPSSLGSQRVGYRWGSRSRWNPARGSAPVRGPGHRSGHPSQPGLLTLSHPLVTLRRTLRQRGVPVWDAKVAARPAPPVWNACRCVAASSAESPRQTAKGRPAMRSAESVKVQVIDELDRKARARPSAMNGLIIRRSQVRVLPAPRLSSLVGAAVRGSPRRPSLASQKSRPTVLPRTKPPVHVANRAGVPASE
jgi:hypothetical protein